MYRVKLALLASTSLCMGMGFSQAADIPVRALVVKAPIVDPWVGFYVGGNLGYSWGRTDTTTSVAPFTQGNPFVFAFPGGASSTSLKPNGVIGGGQFGYIWRIAPYWLAGIETDAQWSGQKNSGLGGFRGFTADCSSGNCSYVNATDITARLSWFGTLRIRTGTEWNGLWIYGTLGLAVGTVAVSGTNTVSLINNNGPAIVGLYSTPFSYSATKAGVTAGVGIEGLIGTSNWRWKAEYIHIDLGSIGGGGFGGIAVNTGRFTDEIVRFGFNYKFGNYYAPVVTK
jgi:outer membrane immunogenic protein